MSPRYQKASQALYYSVSETEPCAVTHEVTKMSARVGFYDGCVDHEVSKRDGYERAVMSV